MNSSALLTALLVLAGLALVAVPLVAPAESPPDRIEHYVEPTDGDTQSWETLHYDTLSEQGRSTFDAARTSETGYYNVTTDELDSVPPFADGTVAVYDIEYDGQWYLLQVKHFRPDVSLADHLFRFGALAGGVLLAMTGGYRAVTA